MHLSVIIPAYNEEKRIEKTLVEIDHYLKEQPYNYEIIVVNDGSKDETIEIVKGLEIANLKTIDNEKNRGKGFAVKQGLLKANGDYRLFTDADNSTPIDELESFLHYLDQYDIIIGSRNISGAKILKPQPLYRKILGDIYSLIVRAFIGLSGVRDTQCGFKLFNSKSVNDILPRCKVNGWSFDSEILIIAKKLGYKIKELPIVWTNNSDTRVKFKDSLKVIFDLLKIKWNLILRTYTNS